MAPSTEEPPAFGQVWQWGGPSAAAPFMLITRGELAGEWRVLWLYGAGRVGFDTSTRMSGLHDLPEHRIPGYRRRDND